MDIIGVNADRLLEQYGQLLVLLVISGLLIQATFKVKNIFNDSVEIKPKNAYVKKLRKKRFSDVEIIKYLKIRYVFEFITLFISLFLITPLGLNYGIFTVFVPAYLFFIDYVIGIVMKIVEVKIEKSV